MCLILYGTSTTGVFDVRFWRFALLDQYDSSTTITTTSTSADTIQPVLLTSTPRILSTALPWILFLLRSILVIKNPLCKDDDTEFKKLTAVYAYAANHATPAAAEIQMQRTIFNIVHGEADCGYVFLVICEGARTFDRLYEESILANTNTPGTTPKSVSETRRKVTQHFEW